MEKDMENGCYDCREYRKCIENILQTGCNCKFTKKEMEEKQKFDSWTDFPLHLDGRHKETCWCYIEEIKRVENLMIDKEKEIKKLESKIRKIKDEFYGAFGRKI